MDVISAVVWGFFILLAGLIWIFKIPISSWLIQRNWLFISPKKGSVVAVTKNETIWGYFGNLSDEELFVIKDTGEIKSIFKPELNKKGKHQKDKKEYCEEYLKQKEESDRDIFQNLLGARWIGLKSIYKYEFEKGVPAESIYLKNVVELEIPDLLTVEQSKVTLFVSFSLQTMNAGKSLNYKKGIWKQYVEDAIESTCREFVGKRSYTEISRESVEHSEEKKAQKAEKKGGLRKKLEQKPTKEEIDRGPGLLERIMALDGSATGNIGLTHEVGQMIVSFRLKKVTISKELVDAGEQPKIAEMKARAAKLVADAEAYTVTANADADAEAIASVGGARNKVLRTTKAILGAKYTANVEIAEKMKDALLDTKLQALSFGNEGIPFILNGEKPAKKEEGQKKKEKK